MWFPTVIRPINHIYNNFRDHTLNKTKISGGKMISFIKSKYFGLQTKEFLSGLLKDYLDRYWNPLMKAFKSSSHSMNTLEITVWLNDIYQGSQRRNFLFLWTFLIWWALKFPSNPKILWFHKHPTCSSDLSVINEDGFEELLVQDV